MPCDLDIRAVPDRPDTLSQFVSISGAISATGGVTGAIEQCSPFEAENLDNGFRRAAGEALEQDLVGTVGDREGAVVAVVVGRAQGCPVGLMALYVLETVE